MKSLTMRLLLMLVMFLVIIELVGGRSLIASSFF